MDTTLLLLATTISLVSAADANVGLVSSTFKSLRLRGNHYGPAFVRDLAEVTESVPNGPPLYEGTDLGDPHWNNNDLGKRTDYPLNSDFLNLDSTLPPIPSAEGPVASLPLPSLPPISDAPGPAPMPFAEGPLSPLPSVLNPDLNDGTGLPPLPSLPQISDAPGPARGLPPLPSVPKAPCPSHRRPHHHHHQGHSDDDHHKLPGTDAKSPRNGKGKKLGKKSGKKSGKKRSSLDKGPSPKKGRKD